MIPTPPDTSFCEIVETTDVRLLNCYQCQKSCRCLT